MLLQFYITKRNPCKQRWCEDSIVSALYTNKVWPYLVNQSRVTFSVHITANKDSNNTWIWKNIILYLYVPLIKLPVTYTNEFFRDLIPRLIWNSVYYCIVQRPNFVWQLLITMGSPSLVLLWLVITLPAMRLSEMRRNRL